MASSAVPPNYRQKSVAYVMVASEAVLKETHAHEYSEVPRCPAVVAREALYGRDTAPRDLQKDVLHFLRVQLVAARQPRKSERQRVPVRVGNLGQKVVAIRVTRSMGIRW